jgi:hypothetical protein
MPSQRRGSPPERMLLNLSVAFRIFLLSLLAAGGLVCLIRSTGPRRVAGPGTTWERLVWRCAPIVLFLGFFWEIFRLEERISEWGRGVVSSLGLYYFRQSYQKAALALLAAGVTAVLVLSSRVVSRNRARLYPVLAGIALAAYASLSLAAAFSFHYIDLLERISLDGISLVDLAKAACAAAVVALALIAPRLRERQERLS